MAIYTETVVKVTGKKKTFVDNCRTLNVDSLVEDHIPFAVAQRQKKGLSPDIVHQVKSLNYVKDVSSSFVQNVITVLREGYSQGLRYSRLAECGSRQAFQARSEHSNRVVSPSRGFSVDMHQVAPTSDRPVCYEVQ